MDYFKLNRLVFDKASIFAVGFLGIFFVCIWSFFEASFWFVAPDFLIAIFSFLVPKYYRKYIYYALIFSLLGGIFYYVLNLFYFELMGEVLGQTFFVSTKNLELVSGLFAQYGVLGAFFQSFTLIPFKIWTHLVVGNGFNPSIYFLIVIVSRAIRFFIIGLVAIGLRKLLRNYVRDNILILFVLFVMFFFGVMFVLEA
jgi:hypothetical protein